MTLRIRGPATRAITPFARVRAADGLARRQVASDDLLEDVARALGRKALHQGLAVRASKGDMPIDRGGVAPVQ